MLSTVFFYQFPKLVLVSKKKTTTNNKITPWLRFHDGHSSMAIPIIDRFYQSLRLRPQNITHDEVIFQLKTRHIIIWYYTSDSQAE